LKIRLFPLLKPLLLPQGLLALPFFLPQFPLLIPFPLFFGTQRRLLHLLVPVFAQGGQ
jgi:hypothetical protein